MSGELSPADVAVLSGNHSNSGYGFGGDGAWWIIIFLIFAMGWRGNGFGGGNDGGNNFVPYPYYFANTNNDMQRGFDQSAIISGINSINGTLADLSTQACNNRFDVVTAINNGNFENRLGQTNIQSQLAQCCCDNKSAIADLKYTVATENCADRQALNTGVRDIIDNQNRGIQLVLDKLCQQEIDAKDDTIANLRTQLNMANLSASQTAQTAQIIADNARQTQILNPAPIPAYVVQNPNCCGCNNYGCGYGNY